MREKKTINVHNLAVNIVLMVVNLAYCAACTEFFSIFQKAITIRRLNINHELNIHLFAWNDPI